LAIFRHRSPGAAEGSFAVAVVQVCIPGTPSNWAPQGPPNADHGFHRLLKYLMVA